MEKLKWYLRQLLPFMYVSEFGEGGKRKVCVWRMWFGRCFAIRRWEVVKGE